MMSKINIVLLSLFILLITQTSFAQTDTAVISDSKGDTSKYTRLELVFTIPIGVGLVRNELSPVIDFHLAVHWKKHIYSLGASTNFLFTKKALGGYDMYGNTYVTFEYYSNFFDKLKSNDTSKDSYVKHSIGIGYLVDSQGGYFGNNTFKVWFGKRYKFAYITPELIVTDNFKTFFPGITIRF